MIASLYTLSALAVILGWIIARREPEHRAIALVLTFGLSSDLAQRALLVLALPPPALDSPPLAGWIRFAGHLESALFVAWPFSIAALALWVFARRRPRIVVVVYLIVMSMLIVYYPVTRGVLLGRVYLGVELASLSVALGALLPWIGRLSRSQEQLTVTSFCCGLLVTGHFAAVVAGPYRFGLFDAWSLAQLSYLAIYLSIVAVQGRRIWKLRR